MLLGVIVSLDSGVGSTITVSCGTLTKELLLERVKVTGVGVTVDGSTGVSVTSTVDPGRVTASAVGLRRVTVVSISERVCTTVVLPSVAVLPSVVPPTMGSQARSPIGRPS